MTPATNRPQKITFAEMRSSGVRGVPIDALTLICPGSRTG
jgi:hypothetical protein